MLNTGPNEAQITAIVQESALSKEDVRLIVGEAIEASLANQKKVDEAQKQAEDAYKETMVFRFNAIEVETRSLRSDVSELQKKAL